MFQHGENCFISSRKSDLFAPHSDTLQQQTQIPALCPVLPSLLYLRQCIPDFADLQGLGQPKQLPRFSLSQNMLPKTYFTKSIVISRLPPPSHSMRNKPEITVVGTYNREDVDAAQGWHPGTKCSNPTPALSNGRGTEFVVETQPHRGTRSGGVKL